MTMQQGRQHARILPGLALCVLVAGAAYVMQRVELATSGRAWIEALVIALLLAFVPYLIIRGLVFRVARSRIRGQRGEGTNINRQQ